MLFMGFSCGLQAQFIQRRASIQITKLLFRRLRYSRRSPVKGELHFPLAPGVCSD